jgi:hypothetical protein
MRSKGICSSILAGIVTLGLACLEPSPAATASEGSFQRTLVHLRLVSDSAFDLDAHTSSGSISVDQPVTMQGTMERKELRGKVHGGGVPVEVETGSGNIEIQ